ncbi:MAG TPA: L,D-transpeptidase, partial [Hyphomicrobiaceae bacterium]|nr:L,D-transpeptidase [Hyphomicrobiaceae bacterium]
MSRYSFIRQCLWTAAAASVVLTTMATSASAQGFFSFLWSGGSRQVVSFPKQYAPGQIIVSFGDRRLYWIHRRGEA